MVVRATEALPKLYEADETAWLEAMADLIRKRRFTELDYRHLSEYLSDMALRERREVESRLVLLLMHILKWKHQPKKRSRSWQGTIVEQRHELKRAIGRGVLRNHALAELAECYGEAAERAAIETGLSPQRFPAECPYTLEQLLSPDVLED